MSKVIFPKLAVINLKKNSTVYIPYMLSCIFTIFAYFTMAAIGKNSDLINMQGGTYIVECMKLGSYITAIFAAIFLYYTNSFLIKRRKKEFGLYSILGLEKKHVGRLMFYETLMTSIISLALGILSSLVFGKLIFMLILKITGLKPIYSFSFSTPALVNTLIVFAIIFAITFISNLIQVQLAKPINLLKGSNKGEKAPKVSWPIAVIGVIILGAGYVIALTTKQPVYALPNFFLAVLLVIIGTYILFMAGSMAFLKILKNNKNYYYQSRNFISVSGMFYRMKQNAAGLATICILSTMVLVTIGTTVSLNIGSMDILKDRNPYDISISGDYSKAKAEKIKKTVEEVSSDKNIKIKEGFGYKSFSTAAIKNGNNFTTYKNQWKDISAIYLLTADEYNRFYNSSDKLNNGEILIYSSDKNIVYKTININGSKYTVKEQLKEFKRIPLQIGVATETLIIVTPDTDTAVEIMKTLSGDYYKTKFTNTPTYTYNYNVVGNYDYDDIEEYTLALSQKLSDQGIDYTVSSIFADKAEWYQIEGSIMFLGIFLGSLFLMATVLIIYYKQISEGLDDHDRFEIMQKVGMDQTEIRKTIKKQILMVFFLPLITSFVHLAFALPALIKILSLFCLTNVPLILTCMGVTALAFAVIYIAVYMMTSRSYYKLVK